MRSMGTLFHFKQLDASFLRLPAEGGRENPHSSTAGSMPVIAFDSHICTFQSLAPNLTSGTPGYHPTHGRSQSGATQPRCHQGLGGGNPVAIPAMSEAFSAEAERSLREGDLLKVMANYDGPLGAR